MRSGTVSHKFVDYIPEELEPSVLYISRRYSTASHLCCCGCGLEVVTPLNPAKWTFSERSGRVSLSPSIGNWSFPCRSHYWIQENAVRWSGAMSPAAIAAVKTRDRRDADTYSKAAKGRIAAFGQRIAEAAGAIARVLRSWWS